MNARLRKLTDELLAAIDAGDVAGVRAIIAAGRLGPSQRIEVVRHLAQPPRRAAPPVPVRLDFDQWDRATIADPP